MENGGLANDAITRYMKEANIPVAEDVSESDTSDESRRLQRNWLTEVSSYCTSLKVLSLFKKWIRLTSIAWVVY